MNWMIQRIFIALTTLNGQLSREDNSGLFPTRLSPTGRGFTFTPLNADQYFIQVHLIEAKNKILHSFQLRLFFGQINVLTFSGIKAVLVWFISVEWTRKYKKIHLHI